MESQPERRLAQITLAALTALALAASYVVARPFVQPVLGAGILAIFFHPFHARVSRRITNPNGAAVVSTALVLLLILVPLFLVGLTVAGEMKVLYGWLKDHKPQEGDWLAYANQTLERPLQWLAEKSGMAVPDLRVLALDKLQQASSSLLQWGSALLSNATETVTNLVITFFTLFFLLRDGADLRRGVVEFLPMGEERVNHLLTAIADSITANIYGTVAVAITQGLLTGAAFWVTGLSSPFLWGVVAAVFSLVPVVGSGLVWVPAAAYLFLSGSWGKGLFLVGWEVGVVSLADNIIRPWLLSGRANLNTLLVFFALIGGLQAFGFIGLFLGPVVLSVTLALLRILHQERLAWERQESES